MKKYSHKVYYNKNYTNYDTHIQKNKFLNKKFLVSVQEIISPLNYIICISLSLFTNHTLSVYHSGWCFF